MRLRMFGATDTGNVRKANQDSYCCDASLGLAIVADGMGGHKGGEIASQIVVASAFEYVQSLKGKLDDEVSGFVDRLLKKVNRDVIQRASAESALKGMGATVNLLQFFGQSLGIGHAGDSRTYLLKAFAKKQDQIPKRCLWQLTVDHNVGNFIDRGHMPPLKDSSLEAASDRQRSRLTKGVGVANDLVPDLYFRKIENGDIFLTCSDGLHGFVSDKAILQSVAEGPIAQAPARLIALVKSAGAPDNVTVVLSVVSDIAEPFQTKTKSPFGDSQPFLVRTPSGEILGPHSATEVISRLVGGEIVLHAEVCAAMGQWVCMANRSRLFSMYKEFDTAKMKAQLAFVFPESNFTRTQLQPKPPGRSFFSVLFILLFLAAATAFYYLNFVRE